MSGDMNRPLTTSETAERLGIKPVTVTWRVRTGKMTPLFQLSSGAYLFDPDVIDAIAAKQGTPHDHDS